MLANWPKPADIATPSPAIFPVVNFLFQFCPPNPSETALLERFAKLNIGPGQTFDFSKFSPEIQQAISDGIKDSNSEFSAVMQKVNNDQVSCSDFFGTRDFLKDNYLYRYVGAKLGVYGNTGSDAIYFGYFVDANHQPLDASRSSYELRFAKGELPPSRVFWSVTMYDGKTQLLIANPLKRYLLNSTTLKSYKYGSDACLEATVCSRNGLQCSPFFDQASVVHDESPAILATGSRQPTLSVVRGSLPWNTSHRMRAESE